eukprot:scaffold65659_cov29-Attheya_sp.AAC.1
MSPMDKRRLMKFMQLALDYATTEGAHIENDRTAAAAEIGASGNINFVNRYIGRRGGMIQIKEHVI